MKNNIYNHNADVHSQFYAVVLSCTLRVDSSLHLRKLSEVHTNGGRSWVRKYYHLDDTRNNIKDDRHTNYNNNNNNNNNKGNHIVESISTN